MSLPLISRLKRAGVRCQLRSLCTSFVRRSGSGTGPGFQEPDYLDSLRPQHPVYDVMNVQMKSYDFPSLERYGGYVHRVANYMGLNVEASWATPPQVFQVRRFKHQSKVVDHEYKIHLYERNVRISDFQCTLMPIFLEVIRANIPEGARLSVHPHEAEHDDIRYIPDIELNSLKVRLDEFHKK